MLLPSRVNADINKHIPMLLDTTRAGTSARPIERIYIAADL